MAKGKLSEYSAKRVFEATPEPAARDAVARSGPLLFIVQQHRATRMHYDFRLECDGVLLSWAVPKGPSLDPADKRLAMQTEDHPFDYASFEGVIPPKQYGAGEVIVWDCGVYSPDEPRTFFDDRDEAQALVRAGMAKGKLSIQLRGEKLKGSFALVRSKDAKQWLMIKHRDRFVRAPYEAESQPRSVLSHASVAEMKSVPAHRLDASVLTPNGRIVATPKSLEPMHAQPVDLAFDKRDWSWEPKLDGYRVIAFVADGKAKLQSRRGLDLTASFPALAAELAAQGPHAMVLDGEVVAFEAGMKPSFNALQNRAQLKTARERAAADAATPAVFTAFDLVHFAGVDLRAAPFRDRRRYLAQCLMPSPLVQLIHTADNGVALLDAALAAGFEGVVGKRKDSVYQPGKRTGAWVKVKTATSAEFVIGGWSKGKGSRADFGSLFVGTFEDGKLVYASNVGSGFDEKGLAALIRKLEPLKRRTCPFAEKPPGSTGATWVEPEVVCEVRFQEWTSDGRLRAPVFVRLRDDKDPREVARAPQVSAPREKREPKQPDLVAAIVAQLDAKENAFPLVVGEHRFPLTHLDREYWPAAPAFDQPALTKRDLLRYLAQVSPSMLPHLADRPVTMIRMPSGIHGQRFFQKHWEQSRPEFLETITLWSGHRGESGEFLLCNNLATLLWLAQSGTLEFHVWHSRARPGPDATSRATDYASSERSLESSILNFPDWVVFDLDPYIYSGKEKKGEEPELNTVAFEKGKEVAFWLRELLNTMGLEPIVKTSGKTGLHVFVPIRRTLDFDAARHVSEQIGEYLRRLHPKDITLEWSIPKRTGKIFMDYNMNVRGKTLNVAYSPRGALGAPVSMPLTWDELANAHPLDFRITNAIERLKRTGDRWADALERKQDLESALAGEKKPARSSPTRSPTRNSRR